MLKRRNRATTCKLLQEAKCCLKCQKFSTSHFVAQCPQTTDMCGTCRSETQCTQACLVDDPAQYCCTNCNKSGHVSWDRNYPTFKAHNNRLQQKNRETNMHFYPFSRDPQSREATSTMNEDHQSLALPPPLSCFHPANPIASQLHSSTHLNSETNQSRPA